MLNFKISIHPVSQEMSQLAQYKIQKFAQLPYISRSLPCIPFPTDESLLLLYPQIHGKCSDGIHPLVLPVLTITAKTQHTMPHPLQRPTIIPFVFQTVSSQELQLPKTDSQADASQVTTISTCSNLGLNVISHAYPYKLFLLFCNLEWLSVFVQVDKKML